MNLSEFLAQSARRDFVWGEFDCLLWLAAWAMQRGHPDLGAPWRGRYATALGCRRLVKREGGMLAISRTGATGAGLAAVPAGEAYPGDIGVGALGSSTWGDEPTGLLKTRIGWAALKAGGGLWIGPATALGVWRV